MNKKKDYEKVYAEIRDKFPGQVVKRIGKNGCVIAYHFTREQSEWITANCPVPYALQNIAGALGMSQGPIERVMAMRDPELLQKLTEKRKKHYSNAKAYRESKKLGISSADYKKMTEASDNEEQAAKVAEVKKLAKKVVKKKQILSDYDLMMKEREKERKKREKKEALEKAKREKEDAAYAAKCLARFPEDRKRKPIPFTNKQTALRSEMSRKGYILSEGEELLTDNRTNVYWDEKTRRNKRLEERAYNLKLSVIKYSDMFPDMSNKLSSCKAECAKRDFYQMN